MNRNEIRSITKEIISQVSGIDAKELESDLILREELMLDSLKEMEIVARTELQFGISIDEELLIHVRTFDDYCGFVEKALESK